MSPIAVYSQRARAPMTPTTASPLQMPMPTCRSGKRHCARVLRTTSCISRAARAARRAWSGAPKRAISPSRKNLFTTPPWRWTTATIASKSASGTSA